jgi:hypothetical protein
MALSEFRCGMKNDFDLGDNLEYTEWLKVMYFKINLLYKFYCRIFADLLCVLNHHEQRTPGEALDLGVIK